MAVDKMRESLVDGKNLENMRIQLAHALQREMRQAWGECVGITGVSFPSPPRNSLHARRANSSVTAQARDLSSASKPSWSVTFATGA